MNSSGLVVAIVALILGGIGGYWLGNTSSSSMGSNATSTPQAYVENDKDIALYTAMRKLWSDHVWYTREYITTFAAGNTAAAQAAATRLLKNQEDIGAAVGQYYGSSAGNQLTALLKTHITQAVDILNDAKANDTTKFNADKAKWQDNANQIADFLAEANPSWPDSTLRSMMQEHLSTTLDEATAALKKDYAGSITAFDKVFDHINKMADALSDGIIKQFPDKFE